MAKTLLPVKFRHSFNAKRTITGLLRQFGMPESICKIKPFWETNYPQLDIILYEAKQHYKTYARTVHPRKDSDSEEAATQLNVLWQEIQRRFKQHMEPTLWVSARKTPINPNTIKTKPGEYARICAYKLCRRVFVTRNRRKIYCHKLHKHYAAQIKYKRKLHGRKRRFHRHCARPKCNKLFVTTNHRKIFHKRRCALLHHFNLNYLKYAAQRRAAAKRYRQLHVAEIKAYWNSERVLEKRRIADRKRYWKPARIAQRKRAKAKKPWYTVVCGWHKCRKRFKARRADRKFCTHKCAQKYRSWQTFVQKSIYNRVCKRQDCSTAFKTRRPRHFYCCHMCYTIEINKRRREKRNKMSATSCSTTAEIADSVETTHCASYPTSHASTNQ